MKLPKIFLPLVAALAFGQAGCSKNETVAPAAGDANKTVDSTADAAAKAAEAAKAGAAKVTEAAKVEAARVGAAKAEAAKAADAAKGADNAKVQGLIDKAKRLVAEGKFADATSVLQQLGGQLLSTDQQKLVEGLKEQLQKALAAKAAGDATGAAGNLLKK